MRELTKEQIKHVAGAGYGSTWVDPKKHKHSHKHTKKHTKKHSHKHVMRPAPY